MIKLRHVVGLAGLAAAVLIAVATPAQAAVVWVQVATPDQPGSDFNQLTGATTVSAGEAWSVGLTQSVGALEFRPLVEHWTSAGGWQLSSSASIAAGTDARLVAVAETAATDVWAMGQIGLPAVMHGLIEHWNGNSWSRVSAPAAEPVGSALAAVAAVSSTDAWAVGTIDDPVSLGRTPLIEHWDGVAWSVVTSPAEPAAGSLTAVTALAANDVWAVGGPHEQIPVALHWNGTSWTSVPVAPPTGAATVLGVAGASANDVWLVGQQGLRTLTEHWNGTAWSVVPSPNGGLLRAVTVLSSGDVWAVGLSTRQSAFNSTLTEHWDGTAWTVVASPNLSGAITTELDGVAGRTGGPLLAVGTSQVMGGIFHAFGVSG